MLVTRKGNEVGNCYPYYGLIGVKVTHYIYIPRVIVTLTWG